MKTRALAVLLAATAGLAVTIPGGLTATASGGLEPFQAVLETPSRFDDEAGGDADADDPAIYVVRGRPERSVVLGTLKNGGLDVYDLQARLLQHVDTPPAPSEDTESGRFNNVDVLEKTPWGPLAVVTDRGRDRLRAYAVDRRGAAAGDRVLTDLTSPGATRLFSATEADVEEQATGYGLALRPTDDATYAVVSRRSRTDLGLFRLEKAGRGGRQVAYRRTALLTLPSTFTLSDGTSWTPCGEPGEGPQVEGMVVDQVRDVLYAAQEDVGVWRIPLRGAGFGRPELIERVREFGRAAAYDPETEECTVSETPVADSGRYLSADAEGLTLVVRDGRPVQLLASSQGDDTFARLGLRGGYQGGYEVVDGPATDSVQESDGQALTTTPLGPRFPRGLLVVHDGQNTPVTLDEDGEERVDTNFKLVPWR